MSGLRKQRLNAQLLRLNLGGAMNETDVFKECVKMLSVEQILSLMPMTILKQN